MPNSEDYIIVWAGVSRELEADEFTQAVAVAHTLIEQARIAGLDHWLDTFGNTPEGRPSYSLLIGERLDVLGYKEGRTQLCLDPQVLQEKFQHIHVALEKIGLSDQASLHVCLRIQE